MRSILLILLIGHFAAYASAQNIDSMMQVLAKEKTSEGKARTLFEIADYWSYRDAAKSFHYLEEGRKKAGSDFLLGLYNFYKGQALFDCHRAESQKAYMQAEVLLKKYTTPEAFYYRTRAWHNFGVLEQMYGNEASFLKILTEICVPLAEKSDNNILLAAQNADIGVIMYNQKQYNKAINYYTNAIQLIKKEKRTAKTADKLMEIYGNLAEVYIFNQDTLKAEKTLDTLKALNLQNPNSAFIVMYYYPAAKYYQLIEDYNSSLDVLNIGLYYAKKFTNITDIEKLIYEKAYCFKRLERYKEAKALFNEVYQSAMARGSSNAIIHLKNLAEIESRLGYYQNAYDHYKQAFEMADSLNKKKVKEEVAGLETKFNTSQKEKAIAELQNKSRIQQILVWSIATILILLSFFYFYAMKQRKERMQQQIQLMEQQREIAVTHALMEGGEQERSRLAKDLHDGIGGTITGIKLKLESAARQNKNSELLRTVDQLDNAVNELRRTSRNLMPESLLKFGLEDAVKDFCETVQSENTAISFYSNSLQHIADKNTQLVVYRIVQELVNNALKHANATEVFLQCTLEDGLLLISIEDNGKGFDVATTKRNMGLNNIKMRVKFLEGKMSIDTQPGKGTSINIECKV